MFQRGGFEPANPQHTLLKHVFRNQFTRFDCNVSLIRIVALLLQSTTVQVTPELVARLKSATGKPSDHAYDSDHALKYLTRFLASVLFWTTLLSSKSRVGRSSLIKILTNDMFMSLSMYL